VHLRLTEALRTQTRRLHTELERSDLMRALLRGQIDRARYCGLLRNLLPIYSALECASARQALAADCDPQMLDELARCAHLVQDLTVLHGSLWEQEIAILPAARDYAHRLHALPSQSPRLLLAHAYVRYLGDLSGGQLVRPIVARTLKVEGAAGTRFYAFGSPEELGRLGQRFRASLDAIAIDPESVAALVAEAQFGFSQHRRLFDQVFAIALPQ